MEKYRPKKGESMEIMPAKFHEGVKGGTDRYFIQQQLDLLPTNKHRQKACDSYSEVYEKEWANCEGKNDQESRARREANTRLVRYVSNVLNAGNVTSFEVVK